MSRRVVFKWVVGATDRSTRHHCSGIETSAVIRGQVIFFCPSSLAFMIDKLGSNEIHLKVMS